MMLENTMEPVDLELVMENVINAVHNKTFIWDSIVNDRRGSQIWAIKISDVLETKVLVLGHFENKK